MLLLFFDTETTGFPNKNMPLDHAIQPHLVQLACLLTTPAGVVESQANLIIEADGYEIPKVAADVHGITTEKSKHCGVPAATALSVFNNLVRKATTIVAHNIDFDLQIMAILAARMKAPNRTADKHKFCTMEATRDIVAIPPTQKMLAAGIRQNKSPKLAEAWEHMFTPNKFENAHDALADVRGCYDIWARLQELDRLRAEATA